MSTPTLDQLVHACDAICRSSDGIDDPHRAARWRALDHALREHLATDERCMLLSIYDIAPAPGSALRVAHADLRGELDAIAHELRAGHVPHHRLARLAALVRAHAEREHEHALGRGAGGRA